MGESTEYTAPKVMLFIAMLFMLWESVFYFAAGGLGILFGIIEIILIIIIFISIDFVGTDPVNLPYFWWLNLIFGVLLILFPFLQAYAFPLVYFPGILLVLAALVEVLCEGKELKASRLMLLLGIAFSIYDCVLCFMIGTIGAIGPAILAIILLIILLILELELFELPINIPNEWWTVLAVAFIMFTWVSQIALLAGYMLGGFGGYVLMIAWVLILFAF